MSLRDTVPDPHADSHSAAPPPQSVRALSGLPPPGAAPGSLSEQRLAIAFALGGALCLLLAAVVSSTEVPPKRERASLQRAAVEVVQQRAEKRATRIATRVQQTLQRGDLSTAELEALRDTLRLLGRSNPEVVELGVVDVNGTLLASSDAARLADAARRDNVLPGNLIGALKRVMDPARTETAPMVLDDSAQQTLTLIIPVGKPAQGALYLVETTSEMEDALSRSTPERNARVPLWLLIGLGLLGLGAAVGFLIVERRQAAHGLQRVQELAELLAMGQFETRLDPQEVPLLSGLVERLNAVGQFAQIMQQAQIEDSLHASRIAEELQSAQVVQQTLMPDVRRVGRGPLQMCGVYRSMSKLSGDWWHYYPLDEHRTLLVLADVIGHGIGPAVVGAMAYGSAVQLHQELGPRLRPDLLLSRLNQAIWSTTKGKYTMSCFAAILDVQTNSLTYASGAHAFPLLFRNRDGLKPFVPLVVPGAPLGSSDTTEFTANTQPFEPGDLLICYTDGLIEAQNTNGESFGDKRVRQTVQRTHNRNVEEICELILGEVSRFVGNSKLDDDQTLVVARNLPASGLALMTTMPPQPAVK